MFSKQARAELISKIKNVNVDAIEDAALRAKARKLKAKQGGFTLLELLVVVAILAAIAGTATIALQDTDARASAAAHVAMMDELNKGIRTFRVLNKNQLPNNFDSLMYIASGDTTAASATILPNANDDDILAVSANDIAGGVLIDGMSEVMDDIGISELRYVVSDTTDFPDGVTSCDPSDGSLQAAVADRGNNMVAGNIFMGVEGNGCGISVDLVSSDTDGFSRVAYWIGSVERVLGPNTYGDAAFDGSDMTGSTADDGATAPVLMAVGLGPSSNLFNANDLGGMTSVPVYRHVSEDQYNRFIGLFKIGEATYSTTGGWSTPVAADQVSFAAIVDGAGDTKEEELGEWDGSRNTI